MIVSEILSSEFANVPHSGGDYHPYAVAPDGQRIRVRQFVPPTTATAGQIGPDTYSGLTVAINWAKNSLPNCAYGAELCLSWCWCARRH